MEQGSGYGIPLDLEHFFRTHRFETKPLHRSIAEHIHLLLITGREEFDFDREFGCEVWDMDFETQSITAVWADRIADGIRDRLAVYEKRLIEVDVDTTAYEGGHLKNAVGFNWQTQLSDRVSVREG